MKIDCEGIAPSGSKVITARLGIEEVEIMRGLVLTALKSTPKTTETSKTLQRLRSMARCLNNSWTILND